MRVGNNDEAVVFGLHAFVLETELAAEFHAADLKPGEIISVVNHTHLVGFGVAHAHCGFCVVRHRRKIVTEWRTRREDGVASGVKTPEKTLDVMSELKPACRQAGSDTLNCTIWHGCPSKLGVKSRALTARELRTPPMRPALDSLPQTTAKKRRMFA